MAIPTVSIVSPTAGPVSGLQLVVIGGTGFALPPAPPATGPVPTPPPSVSVVIGGRQATRVDVLSSTELHVITPALPAGVHDVVVQNNDAFGIPVSGETVTAVGAYTARRPDFRSKCWSVERVMRQLVLLLREQVLDNTVVTTHTDYDGSPTDGENVVEVAVLPAVVVGGPTLTENRFYADTASRTEGGPGGVVRQLPIAWTGDAVFTIAAISDSTVELLGITQALVAVAERFPLLELLRDPDDQTKGYIRYELEMPLDAGPRVVSTPSNSNVRMSVCSVVVRGIELALPDDLVVGETAPVGETTSQTGAVDPDVHVDGGVVQFGPLV